MTTGRVSVMRLGGGFGESVTGATHPVVSFNRAWPGKREQVCPSGPIPRSNKSKTGILTADP